MLTRGAHQVCWPRFNVAEISNFNNQLVMWERFTSLLLTGYRSMCFSSVLGSEEAFSVTGEEVAGL